jgi:hypothetical protein
MANMGKVRRFIRETAAVLVEELGPEEAARILEHAAAQVRGTAYQPKQVTAHDQRPVTARPQAAANR